MYEMVDSSVLNASPVTNAPTFQLREMAATGSQETDLNPQHLSLQSQIASETIHLDDRHIEQLKDALRHYQQRKELKPSSQVPNTPSVCSIPQQLSVPAPSPTSCMPFHSTPFAPFPSLLHLPRDVLASIFLYLSDLELYRLSLLSRTLNQLAPIIALTRHGALVGNDRETVRLNVAADMYQRLLIQCARSALSITQVQSFTVALSAFHVAPCLTAATRLAMVKDGFQQVHLTFDARTSLSVPAQDALVLFLSVLSRKQCTSLRLNGGLTSHLNKGGGTHIPSLNTLTELELSTAVVFPLTFRQWLIDTLNSSPIVSLTVKLPLSASASKHILPQLYIPTLRSLTLAAHLLEMKDLVRFLRRHPSIDYMVIFRASARVGLPLRKKMRNFLPNLNSISAPHDVLSYLLTHPLNCPKIIQLQIWKDTWELFVQGDCWRWPGIPGIELDIRHPLANIIAGRKGVRLILPLLYNNNRQLDDFIDRDAFKLSSRNEVMDATKQMLSGVISVKLTNEWTVQPFVPEWLALFGEVEELMIGNCMPSEEEMASAMVRKAREMCPGLKRMCFGHHSEMKDVEEWLE